MSQPLTLPSGAAEEAAPNELRMSLAEHLIELRKRLLRCVISVLVLGGGSLVFAKQIYGLLMRPVLLALPPEASSLVYTSAIEEINVYMKVGLYSGIFLTTPVILWQLWGFVSPGLYAEERRLAAPFVGMGTAAFLTGALFCYFAVLPTMFQFLLREERAIELERKLDLARMREQDALLYLRLGEVAKAGEVARSAQQDLDGAQMLPGDLGVQLVPKASTQAMAQLEALGRLVAVAHDAWGASAAPVLQQVLAKRAEAAEAFGDRDFSRANALADEAAGLLAGVAPANAAELSSVWRLERSLGTQRAQYESLNWTRPMLSMSEQLTLVLVLELAFGVIFELPLVMALLGLVGLVKASWLMKYQRHAFVVCLILAAVLTPTGDVVNLSLMAGPMLLCFELGVLAVWLLEKRRSKATPSTP